MRLRIVVKPGAHVDSVSREPDGSLLVSVRARAQEGKANEAVVKAVAAYLHVPKTSVRIRSGLSGRTKLLEVPDQPGPTLPIIG
jgi:uncharacterized protein YggU (UPF0235/DUF167 family)